MLKIIQKITVLGACLLLNTAFLYAKGTPAIKVNDVTITKESIDSVVELLSQQQFAGRTLTSEEHGQLVKMVAGNFVSQELFLKEAKTKNITVSDQAVDSMMGVFKKSFPSTAEYQSALARVGDNENSLKKKMKRQLVLEKVVTSVVSTLERPSEAVMQKYFKQHKDKFPKDGALRASQILLKLPKKASVTIQEEKRKKLEKLRDLIVAETKLDLIVEKFTRLALAHSEGPQAQQGGDLGPFKYGDFMPEFDKQIKKLSVSHVSEVFKTDLGFHLVLLTEKNDGTYENSRLKVMQLYVMEKTQENQEKMQKHLKSLVKKNNVKYFNKRYEGQLSSDFKSRASK